MFNKFLQINREKETTWEKMDKILVRVIFQSTKSQWKNKKFCN